MTEIRLPHRWKARPYQDALWQYLANGGKRAVAVWHRRAGKDQVALHWATVASQRRVGVYWHMLPTLRQGRKVVWENIDGDGNRFLDAWPGWRNPGPDGLVSHIRNDDMKLELNNGSVWYTIGSDNYDSVMGTNPVGVVFSEYSLSDPAAWDFVRPILSENGGWALFIFTPRGRNHGYHMYEMAKDNPDWFAQRLTVEDTGAISLDAVQAERAAGMAEELIQQEYYCSFEAPITGAFWAQELIDADHEGRITTVRHDPAALVHTWWDIGYSDATAVWYAQIIGNEIHLIAYDEVNGNSPQQDVAMLNRRRDEFGYTYGRHIFPHDGGAKTKASAGRPLSSLYGDLNYQVEVQRRYDVQVAITKVRQTLSRCWFDEKQCAAGLDALRAFRKQEDLDKSLEGRPYFKPGYVHDWSSHGASAFYTGCMTHFDTSDGPSRPKRDRYSGQTVRTASAWGA